VLGWPTNQGATDWRSSNRSSRILTNEWTSAIHARTATASVSVEAYGRGKVEKPVLLLVCNNAKEGFFRTIMIHRGPIKWRSALRNTIYDVLQSKKEWVETDNETDWDFFWADKG
jgi:hypothetical protein